MWTTQEFLRTGFSEPLHSDHCFSTLCVCVFGGAAHICTEVCVRVWWPWVACKYCKLTVFFSLNNLSLVFLSFFRFVFLTCTVQNYRGQFQLYPLTLTCQINKTTHPGSVLCTHLQHQRATHQCVEPILELEDMHLNSTLWSHVSTSISAYCSTVPLFNVQVKTSVSKRTD